MKTMLYGTWCPTLTSSNHVVAFFQQLLFEWPNNCFDKSAHLDLTKYLTIRLSFNEPMHIKLGMM